MTNLFFNSGMFLIAMIVESAWLYAIFEILNRKVFSQQLNVPMMLLLLPLSFAANMLVKRFRWPQFAQIWMGWAVWLLVLLILVKLQLYQSTPWSDLGTWLGAIPRSSEDLLVRFTPEMMLLASTPFIWWFGQRLAYLQPDFGSALGDLQLGIIALVMTFLINMGLNVTFPEAVPVTIAFFGFALLGVSLAHGREHNGWLSGVYRGQWTGLLILTIGVILGAGFVLGALLAPGLLDTLLAAAGWVWNQIVAFLTWLATLMPRPSPENLPPMPGGTPPPSTQEPLFDLNIPENVRNIMRIMWTVLFFGIFAFAMWRIGTSVLGWLRRVLTEYGADVEPMEGAFKADFMGLLKAFFHLLSFKLRLPGSGPKKISLEAMTVRQVYGQMLKWGADIGHPRGPAQTPDEYLNGTLNPVMPEQEPGMALITDYYVKARYGSEPLDKEDIGKVKDIWGKLKGYKPRKKQEKK